ncbi:MAG: threonine synthase [Candidatus Thorarchaeota archaeon]
MTLMTGLVCTRCGRRISASVHSTICPHCGGVLQVEYDLDHVAMALTHTVLQDRSFGIWRFKELLPVSKSENMVSLGEGGTYLHRCNRLSSDTGLKQLFLKDETRNPTGSFIDRGMAVELSMALERRYHRVCCGSVGNIGVSLVAYAARAGLESKVIMARSDAVDMGKFYQVVAYGADVKIVRQHEEIEHELDRISHACHTVVSTNPFFLEGLKTTIFEVIEQLGWHFPDWIIVPMGSGGHLTQIWKGLSELHAIGMVKGDLPHLIGVQSNSCAPIVASYDSNIDEIVAWPGSSGIARDIGMRRPRCGLTALRAIRASGGLALSVSDSALLDAVRRLAHLEGVFAEPASATVIAVLNQLVDTGIVDASESVVCIITGMGLKSPEVARDLVRGHVGLERLLSNMEGRKFTGAIGRTKHRILEILEAGEAYGYEVWKRLAELYDIHVKIPSVYQHLVELRTAGLVVQSRIDHTFQGRPRVYYALTERGRSLLAGS